MKKIEDCFNSDKVIHCQTFDEWIRILNILKDNHDCFDSDFYSDKLWLTYSERSCLCLLHFPMLSYSPNDYFRREGFEIINSSEIVSGSNQVKTTFMFEVSFEESL
jgi:hypothetical protein